MITLIVGLGNPGNRYVFTRHNVGFMVLDLLEDKADKILEEKETSWAILRKIKWEDLYLTTLRPLTYMNNSGEAVAKVLTKEKINPTEMIVIHDDLDLPLGRIKISRGGSSGGHRGVQSIIDCIGTKEFPRLKVGIGRPLRGEEVTDYVLSPPYADERSLFRLVLNYAVQAVEVACRDGIEKAMNIFNGLVIEEH
ncbi:MAG: aminoacyl-tRNA hydrolase [Thermodesulforhabdaceae bacterium]|jgi:PTH1 family peptidyl-tRNA hydrolase